MYRINHFLLLFVLFVYIIFSIQIFTINAKKKKSNSKKPSKVTGKCKTTKNKCINTTKGKYVWSTGDFYKGQFNVNGVMEGKGLIRWKKTKDVYEGTFKNGLPDGVGLYWWGKGTQRYLGQFKKGRKNGLGVYRNVENDDEIYAGEFKNGLFSGLGKLSFSNGTIIIGMFKNGLPNGKNKRVDLLDYKEGLAKYLPERTFLKHNDTRVRRIYYGSLNNSQRHGHGVLNINHSTHIGMFENDIPIKYVVYNERNLLVNFHNQHRQKSNNNNTDETFYMNDNNFTNNTYIGTYLGGFHGFAKLLLFDKNFNVTDEILKIEKIQANNAAEDLAEDTESEEEEEEEEKDEPQQQREEEEQTHNRHHVYYGKTKDGVAHGDGQWQYRDGEIYTGESINGKRDGFGILESIFGDRLIGNWSNDSFVFGTKSGPMVGSFAGHFNPKNGRFLFGKIISRNGDIYIGECNKNYDNTYGVIGGTANGYGVSINSKENKKYIGEFKNGKRDGFGVYYDTIDEEALQRNIHDVEDCDDFNDNYICDDDEEDDGDNNNNHEEDLDEYNERENKYGKPSSSNSTIQPPTMKPKYVGLWFENKFVPYNEEIVSKEIDETRKKEEEIVKADTTSTIIDGDTNNDNAKDNNNNIKRENTVEENAKLWHSAFYTKKAWEIHYQATQIIKDGYKDSTEAIALSRFVQYTISERVQKSIIEAKNATSMAYMVKKKALQMRSETLRLVSKVLTVVNNSLKMEKMIGANSKYLKKKQKRFEKKMKQMKNEEYRKEHKKKNDNSAVNFEYGDSEKDNVLPKNEKKKTFNFKTNKWEEVEEEEEMEVEVVDGED